MFIGGLQKLSLQDFPGRVSCIVFLVGCNARCKYCYNKELISKELFSKSNRKEISENELFKFLKERKNKLSGVVITGGEPTVVSGLVDLIKKIKKLGFEVKLDTNGTNPKILKKIIDENLVDYIAMDIKAPIEKYSNFVFPQCSLDKIKNSIDLIKNSKIEHEFRTTLYPDLNISDFKKMNSYIENENWFLQQIELSNTLDPSISSLKKMRLEKIKEIINVCTNNNVKLRGY